MKKWERCHIRVNDDSSLFVSLFSASKYFIWKSSKVGTTTLKLRALFYRPTTKYSHGASIKARGFQIFSAHIAPEAQIHLRHTSSPLASCWSVQPCTRCSQSTHTHTGFVYLTDSFVFLRAAGKRENKSGPVKRLVWRTCRFGTNL